MGIYWKPETAAKGDATEKNHKDWIKLDSISFGSGRTVKTPTGRVADRQADTGQVSEITITKDMDTSSMKLFKATCVGTGEKMELHVTRAGALAGGEEIVYLKYTLENALVTSYSFNSTGGQPTETLTLNFTKITMAYTPQDAAAKGTGDIPVTFDQGATAA